MQVSETFHLLVPRFSQALRKLFNNVDFEVTMQVLISQNTSRKCERNSDKVYSKAGRAFRSGKHLQKAEAVSKWHPQGHLDSVPLQTEMLENLCCGLAWLGFCVCALCLFGFVVVASVLVWGFGLFGFCGGLICLFVLWWIFVWLVLFNNNF